MTSKIIKVSGIVQGVGFRPFVHRIAEENNIKGYVINKGPFVEIAAQGEKEDVELFIKAISQVPPERAEILDIEISNDTPEETFESFEIRRSHGRAGDDIIFIPPDIAICPECEKELYDKSNRRYLHPLINCTVCGPRLTIIDSLPYDRPRTSMKDFKMCPDCEAEYHDINSRRYDAQPVCCRDCGPKYFILSKEKEIPPDIDPIKEVRKVLISGGIAAVKGIGGFHLCCDAKDDKAVERLRKIKHRLMKPFAVMMKDIGTAGKYCAVTKEKESVLRGPIRPIVLLDRKKASGLSELIAPDNDRIGTMLPYAPVQLLLFRQDDELDEKMPDALIMTSANISGEPIIKDDDEITEKFFGKVDIILSNDREILTRADDTVMDFYDDAPYVIRRSRGLSPLPVSFQSGSKKNVLAFGGELKNSFCIGKGGYYYLSPYIGDMEKIRTVEAQEDEIERFLDILDVRDDIGIVACDMHPNYRSSAAAEEFAKKRNLPLIKVQHHFAHIYSVLAENVYNGDCIGCCFDGTGYGLDETIWGGEILLLQNGEMKRASSITPFIQAGGDLAAREGWRIAVSMIYEETGRDRQKALDMISSRSLCKKEEAEAVFFMIDSGINTITSTSVGRLFDAASAFLGIRKSSTFEGEAAMALQTEAERFLRKISDGEKGELSHYFHEKLAEITAEKITELSEKTGIKTAALSGGSFQNTLLMRLLTDRLKENGMTVFKHSFIPANDGGIALGQAAFASGAFK